MRSINYLLLAVLLLGGCTSVFGEDSVSEPPGLNPDQLDQVLKLHITPEQLREITRRAEQGDAIDQTFLGILYQNGWEGLPQHYQLAAKWFKLAAEQGDVGAQFNLGLMYHRGLGVPQNYQLAFKWSLLAAEQGNAIAQAELGDLYAFGKGVNQDIYEGLKWYTRAAEQGNADAQYQLGLVYYYGKGIPQNFVLAHKWINLAAAQGDKDAANSKAYLPNKMTPSQIQEAQRLAREFKPKKESQ